MRKRPDFKSPTVSSEEEETDIRDVKSLSFMESLIAFDEKWTSALSICAHEDSPMAKLRPLMKALEISFHGLLWLGGTVVAFFMTHRHQDIECVVNLFFMLIFDLLVVGAAKVIFRRSRPVHNQMDMFGTVSIDLFSFPSGHSTRAAMVATFFILNVVKKRFAPFVIAFGLCLGLSRIMLGRHHVLDVFFGFVIGILEYFAFLSFWLPFTTIEFYLQDFLSHVHM